MKSAFKISFYIMFTGWFIYMLLVLLSIFIDVSKFGVIVFMIGLLCCFVGFISFHFMNRDNNFFKTQDELVEKIKDLEIEKEKTFFLNKALEEKIKEDYDNRRV